MFIAFMTALIAIPATTIAIILILEATHKNNAAYMYEKTMNERKK